MPAWTIAPFVFAVDPQGKPYRNALYTFSYVARLSITLPPGKFPSGAHKPQKLLETPKYSQDGLLSTQLPKLPLLQKLRGTGDEVKL